MAKKVDQMTGSVKLPNGMIASFDMRAMVELEDMTDVSAIKFIDRLTQDLKIKDAAIILCAMLKRHQPDMDLNKAIDVLDEVGPQKIFEIINASAPTASSEGNE